MVEDTDEAREAAKMNADVPKEHAALGCTSGYLPEAIIIWEILTRLPPKAVLRCRAVCMSWCRLTSTREFVLAHHRNQPPLPIVEIDDDIRDFRGGALRWNFCVLVPSLEDTILRPIIRYTTPHGIFDDLTVLAACDGLLLISLNSIYAWKRHFYICNPATRRRALLRQLVDPLGTLTTRIVGLYPHRASGEYRVLYWTKSPESSAVYHVLTLGSDGEPRCIGRPTGCESVEEMPQAALQTAVLFRGNLHWGLRNHSDIMVFDTEAETFGSLRRPSVGQVELLFEMEGTIAMICRAATVYLWLLQDYEDGLWTFKHRIDILPLSHTGDLSWERNVVVFGEHDLLVSRPWHISYCDIKGKQLRIIEYGQDDVECSLTPHRLQVSLAPLTFFGMHENDDGDDPPFFEDLLSDLILPLDPLFRL